MELSGKSTEVDARERLSYIIHGDLYEGVTWTHIETRPRS